MCSLTLLPGLMSSRYHALTTTIWLVKSLCNSPLYLQLILHTNCHTKMISPQTNVFSVVLYYVSLLFYSRHFFILSGLQNTLIFLLACLGGFMIGIQCYSYNYDTVSSPLGTIFSGIHNFNIPYTSSLIVKLLIIFLVYMFLHILILCVISIKELLANNIKVVWKAVSVISVITYILNYHYSEFSFILAILGIVVIAAVVLIVLDHKSVYAISFIIVLIVIYYISVLYESWTDNSIIPQVTCQLTVLGALLYTLGYDYAASLKTTCTATG